MTDGSGANEPRLIVHLVHGTWAHGFLRRVRLPLPRWFEEGSEFRKNVALHAGIPIRFEPFDWSGRNSVRARYLAAKALSRHLADARSEWPDARHVVFAHSHGGSVAARVLSGMDADGATEVPEVDALVCLGTPFAYLGRSSDHDGIFAFGVGAIASALLALAAVALYPRLLDLHAMALLAPWALSIAWLGTFFRAGARFLDGAGSEMPRRTIPRLLLMRATRDEAALIIGLGQAVHSIAGLLLLRARRNETSGRAAALRYCLLTALLLLIGNAILGMLGSPFDLPAQRDQRFVLVIGTALAFLGGAYILCYAFVAASVGFWDIGRWPTRIIEVDLAPPGMPAVYKCYSEFDRSQAEALRHGIYEVEAVQRDLGAIARAAHDGSLDRFDLPTQIAPGRAAP